MAITVIVKDNHGKQVEISVELDDDMSWEEKCYQMGCEVAREMAKLWLILPPESPSAMWMKLLGVSRQMFSQYPPFIGCCRKYLKQLSRMREESGRVAFSMGNALLLESVKHHFCIQELR